MRKEAVIGDVFEIPTPLGLGYLQYIRHDPRLGEFIQVLRPLVRERPASLNELFREPERFLTFFPLAAAYSRRIVERVGNLPVAPRFQVAPTLRSPGKISPQRRVVESWWIVDDNGSVLVDSLTEDQKRLSIKAIINDTLLIERLVNDWSPADYV